MGRRTYDSNGNLTSTASRLSYDYDAENQLKCATYTALSKTELKHDGRGRLREKIDYSWNGSSWVTGTPHEHCGECPEHSAGNAPTGD
jgi:YD repeat-containing protein